MDSWMCLLAPLYDVLRQDTLAFRSSTRGLVRALSSFAFFPWEPLDVVDLKMPGSSGLQS